jgi:hypothetical protein
MRGLFSSAPTFVLAFGLPSAWMILFASYSQIWGDKVRARPCEFLDSLDCLTPPLFSHAHLIFCRVIPQS